MPGRKRITNVLYHGYASGMCWETKPEWDQQRNANISRKLLENADMDKLNKSLRDALKPPNYMGLPSLKKDVIDEHFALIYDYASHNVKRCANMDPVAFFAAAKHPFAWAGPIDPEHLWKFTYRALMARDIFLDILAGDEHTPSSSMVQYLDAYKDAFFHEYDQGYGDAYLALPAGQQDPEALAHTHARRAEISRVTALYFPLELTCAGGKGDGTDRQVVVDPSRATSSRHVFRKNNNDKPLDSSDDEDSEDDGEEKQKAADAEEEAAEEEYQKRLHAYELKYDIYMGRHPRNLEEDTEMSDVISKLGM
ncbi:hypothetical protein PG993_011971 [Apiospora rasikravindrae]|uniref:Uncharacterized protein n=1 Tax=Apiospora rasikravindrae TaxID=990691 RepID=A0ABR1S169_9PEZI